MSCRREPNYSAKFDLAPFESGGDVWRGTRGSHFEPTCHSFGTCSSVQNTRPSVHQELQSKRVTVEGSCTCDVLCGNGTCRTPFSSLGMFWLSLRQDFLHLDGAGIKTFQISVSGIHQHHRRPLVSTIIWRKCPVFAGNSRRRKHSRKHPRTWTLTHATNDRSQTVISFDVVADDS